MGHAMQILRFENGEDMKTIQTECDAWLAAHVDRRENPHPGSMTIRATRKGVFETLDAAEEYLHGTFGNYRCEMVSYYHCPKRSVSKREVELKQKIAEAATKVNAAAKTHYLGSASKFVTCRHCEAKLPTSYCGTRYHNHCPVCGADIRPQSAKDKDKAARAKLAALEKQLRTTEIAEDKKNKRIIAHAVACECHC